jgi:hypothetical protein
MCSCSRLPVQVADALGCDEWPTVHGHGKMYIWTIERICLISNSGVCGKAASSQPLQSKYSSTVSRCY